MTLFEDNAEILRRLEAKGCDLGSARPVDFAHLFPDQASAEAFADDANLRGFSAKIERLELDDEVPSFHWDVTVTKEMRATCETMTDNEERLARMARSYGGGSGGWGFFDA